MCVEYFTFSFLDATTIERKLNYYVSKRTVKHTGLERPIEWFDEIYDSYEIAKTHIEQLGFGNYRQIALQYKDNIRIRGVTYKAEQKDYATLYKRYWDV